MSRNRHRVTIRSIPTGVRVYYWDDVAQCPHYVFIDSLGKRVYPDVVYDEEYGNIYTSPVRDCYGNRDCVHSYLEFSGTIGISKLPGFASSIRTGNLYQRINSFGTGKKTGTVMCGWGDLSAEWQRFVVSNDESVSVIRTYYQGRHATTITVEVLSCVLPVVLPGSVTYVRKRTVTPSSYYGKLTGLKESVTVESFTTSCFYLGTTTWSVMTEKSYFDTIFSKLYQPKILTHFVPDSLTDDIFDNLVIPDVNNVENLKDLKQIRSALDSVVRLMRKRSIKTIAEFYLWYKYVYSTTCMDLAAWYKFFLDWAEQVNAKSDTKRIHLKYDTSIASTEQSTQYNIITDTYNCGILTSLGLDINLSNVWDTLPFSFVVDWFINLGDVLSKLDHIDTVSHMKVRTIVSTTKRITRCQPLASLFCDDNCSFVSYDRTITNTLPTGNVSFSLKNPLKHIAEGTALFISIKK